jgi:1-phosphatidylinositol phosphodiesterase
MPGTHDSGAILDAPIPGTAKAQGLTIAQQLDIGVRYLDIRLTYVSATNSLHVFHGPIPQPYSFDDVLSTCYAFLGAHPTETIIMSIKEEVPPGTHSYPWSFEQIVADKIAAHPYQWFQENTDPFLSMVRARIVLVRRFKHGGGTAVQGIDATVWPRNKTDNAGDLLHVEDHYDLGSGILNSANYDTKFKDCFNHMIAAFNSSAPRIYLTYTSGTFMLGGVPLPGSITRLAGNINPRIRATVAPWMGKVGVIVMDYIDSGTAWEIIDTNARWTH